MESRESSDLPISNVPSVGVFQRWPQITQSSSKAAPDVEPGSSVDGDVM